MSSFAYKLKYLTIRLNSWKNKATTSCNGLRELTKVVVSRDLTIANLRVKLHKLKETHQQETNKLKDEFLESFQADKETIEQLEYQIHQLKQADDAKKNSLLS